MNRWIKRGLCPWCWGEGTLHGIPCPDCGGAGTMQAFWDRFNQRMNDLATAERILRETP